MPTFQHRYGSPSRPRNSDHTVWADSRMADTDRSFDMSGWMYAVPAAAGVVGLCFKVFVL